ncbi:MAG: hypothetical protein CMA64_07665 [Euryarchaeota archaeon]|nr:hypothetical protein [Euryarchaeota archaeon]
MFGQIKFHQHPSDTKGKQAIIDFVDYKMSIVCSPTSYGGDKGLYEIAVFDKDGEFVDLKGISNKNDNVHGWLRENEVVLVIEKMCEITNMDIRLVLLRSAFREKRDDR